MLWSVILALIDSDHETGLFVDGNKFIFLEFVVLNIHCVDLFVTSLTLLKMQ